MSSALGVEGLTRPRNTAAWSVWMKWAPCRGPRRLRFAFPREVALGGLLERGQQHHEVGQARGSSCLSHLRELLAIRRREVRRNAASANHDVHRHAGRSSVFLSS